MADHSSTLPLCEVIILVTSFEAFRARVALFVGTAGGLKDVRHGDVVVATKIYAYESGKAGVTFEPRPEMGRTSYAFVQRANQEALTDDWLTRLSDNPRPDPVPRVLLGPLAAGNVLLVSTHSELAERLRATYGDTLAVEMEGHGFLQAVEIHPNVHGMVIRGIANLLDDKETADAAGWPAIAARHAAAFAFQVLAHFTLPGATDSKPPRIWNVPFARNSFFTGRDELLAQVRTQLDQTKMAALGQPQAISGLGGVGKTQLAVEYAYRYREEYQAVLWARAESIESLNGSYAAFAQLLDVPQREAQEQAIVVQAVKEWLRTQEGWLLVLDNADEPEILEAFLPPTVRGQVLVTTRNADLTDLGLGFGPALAVRPFADEQGAVLLLHRSGQLALDERLDQADPEQRTRALALAHELGGLALALDQAGAYLHATKCGLEAYQRLYTQYRPRLLAQRRNKEHPESVATTWLIAFGKVEQQEPVAGDILRLCAFLAPDAIPEILLTVGAREDEETQLPIAADPFVLNQAIECLLAYSLLTRDAQAQTLSVHRLVQAVLRDTLPEEIQQQWMRRTVNVVDAAFPALDFVNWSVLERLLPHALYCMLWIEQTALGTLTSARLLNQAGYYLHERGRYGEAEGLYKRSLGIREEQLGGEHPSTAVGLNNLALLYKRQGRYGEAEGLYKRSLAIAEQQLGADHPSTATSLNNLAILYFYQGRYGEAEPLLKRACIIRLQRLGEDHPDTQSALRSYALLVQAMEQEAETQQEEGKD